MPRPTIPQRRERLLDAAESLVLERGFAGMTVQALAERVGIAKGAVYREFETKDAVLDAILRRGYERLRERSAQLLGTPTPSLSAAYRVGVEVLLDDPLMTAAFLDDAGVLGSYAASVTDGRYRQRLDDVAEWIAELQAQGRVVKDVEATALALALSSATIGLLTAARHVGPLNREDLRAALGALERLVSGLEPSN